MNIWVIKDGEVLPLDAGASRMRTGMLASELARRGHAVTWWASTFAHQTKTRLFDRDTTVRVEPRLELRLLDGGSYRGNVSLGRVRHHRIVGRRFAAAARGLTPPNAIVAAFPTIDLAWQAGRYARQFGVPLIVDVRDLWPETLVDRCPRPMQPLARLALTSEYRRARQAILAATAVAAISPGCLDWALRTAGRPRANADGVFFIGRHAHAPSGAPSQNVASLLARLRGKVVFTYVGTFGHSYDLAVVAGAAAELHRRGIADAHFVLAGHGHQRGHLERSAAALPNLTVTDWLDRNDLAHLLGGSSVGLVPLLSVPQAFSNKIFEYMSAGLPMLTCVRGETAQLISDHRIGDAYQAGSVSSLTDAVLRMLAMPDERARMAARSLALFERRFRADRIYAGYADLVERLAHGALARQAS